MPSQLYGGSASISTTPFSLVNGSTTGASVTTPDNVSAMLEIASMAAGDRYEINFLDKTQSSGGTQRSIHKVVVQGPGAPLVIMTPFLPMVHGWDVQVTKLAGTDRTVTWSLRKP
jgi:hypothetical protein